MTLGSFFPKHSMYILSNSLKTVLHSSVECNILSKPSLYSVISIIFSLSTESSSFSISRCVKKKCTQNILVNNLESLFVPLLFLIKFRLHKMSVSHTVSLLKSVENLIG